MGETTTRHSSVVQVRVGAAFIDGDLVVPQRAAGLVVFAHGSGRSRFSRRNRMVAEVLQQDAFATLLLDLLTRAEEAVDLRTGEIPFRHRPAGPSRNRRIGLGRRRPASERAPDRLLWCQHRGRGDVVCRGGASRSRGRGHLAGRKARSGWRRAAARAGAYAADRGRRRRAGDRAQSSGHGAYACAGAPRDRARRHTPVRGARRARAGVAAGGAVVPPAPDNSNTK